ncbi:MAG: glycine cleavage system protein GcvH [Acidobacteriaceae bacterium]
MPALLRSRFIAVQKNAPEPVSSKKIPCETLASTARFPGNIQWKVTNPMAYPNSYHYTREHEWIQVEGAIGTVGITDYAQNSLGDIVFVDAPKVGDTVEAGKVFGSVESVKAVSDLYSPVSGTVIAVNQELVTAPEKINTEPHQAWIIKVQLAKTSEVDALLNSADYEKFISEETHA